MNHDPPPWLWCWGTMTAPPSSHGPGGGSSQEATSQWRTTVHCSSLALSDNETGSNQVRACNRSETGVTNGDLQSDKATVNSTVNICGAPALLQTLLYESVKNKRDRVSENTCPRGAWVLSFELGDPKSTTEFKSLSGSKVFTVKWRNMFTYLKR